DGQAEGDEVAAGAGAKAALVKEGAGALGLLEGAVSVDHGLGGGLVGLEDIESPAFGEGLFANDADLARTGDVAAFGELGVLGAEDRFGEGHGHDLAVAIAVGPEVIDDLSLLGERVERGEDRGLGGAGLLDERAEGGALTNHELAEQDAADPRIE